MKEKRTYIRNKIWGQQKVVLKELQNKSIDDNSSLFCELENIGSNGMFVSTKTKMKNGTNVSFQINFRSDSCDGPVLRGEGLISRTQKNGLAIKFIKIDIEKFRGCIIWIIDNQ